ncbi:hypothetical protein C4573_03305 [Candidatus Woesearchaeota archaeon]|nr:MAG: hypothetical protein C4573_03305 [Candidatus Woesearchaeota archaeon]
MTKKGEMGISTLILTTSMIIVSAVVFMVFFDVVRSVESETHSAGMVIKKNIGTGIHVIKIYGEDGSTNNDVDYLYEEIKLPYGSDEIKINDTLVIVSLSNDSREYTYNNNINCSINDASAGSIYNTTYANNYGAQHLRGAATYTDTIVAGEVVRICFKLPRAIEKEDRVLVSVIAKEGFSARTEINYRKLITDKTIYFFP